MPELRCYAKINLTLEVLGRYSDGYHEIKSIMQLIDLYDELSFDPDRELKFSCSDGSLAGSNNLVIRAARLLQEATQCERGALIRLKKGIPVSSGLGGGSSDAATTLKALNELWKLGLGETDLKRLGAQLGSDVPFFLNGSAALVEGRGENITPLRSPPAAWVVLVKPPLQVASKTRTMYGQLTEVDFTRGAATEKMLHAWRRRSARNALCYNAFDRVAASVFPGLDGYRLRFLAAGARNVRLAGSGPTLFSLAESKNQGEELCSRLEGEVYLVRTL